MLIFKRAGQASWQTILFCALFATKPDFYAYCQIHDGREKFISFCEACKEPIDVKNASEVLAIRIGGLTLTTIFAELPDSAFDIY